MKHSRSPRRPRKAKTAPEHGSCRRTSCAFAAQANLVGSIPAHHAIATNVHFLARAYCGATSY